jgi:hypothetical protein
METAIRDRKEAALLALAKSDFSGELSKAELRTIHDSTGQQEIVPGSGGRAADSVLRSAFLRWLLSDKRVAPLLDKHGIQVVSSTIEGEIDLDGFEIPCNLTFRDCAFRNNVHFIWARTKAIQIVLSHCEGDLNLQGALVDGDLNLSELVARGHIMMYGTHIAGDFYMRNSKISSRDAAVDIHHAAVEGGAYLEQLICEGPLRIRATEVGDHLLATGAILSNVLDLNGTRILGNLNLSNLQSTMTSVAGNAGALDLAHSRIEGSVYLNGATVQCKSTSVSLANATVDGEVNLAASGTVPFRAAGTVSLWEAVVGETVIVNEAELAELDCSGARLGGLSWTGVHTAEHTRLRLTHAAVRNFEDIKTSWPARGNLFLVGFTYEQIQLEVPPDLPDLRGQTRWKGGGTNPDDRIAWLRLQSDADRTDSQPWMELAQYVASRGDSPGSRKVIYAMDRVQPTGKGLAIRTGTYPFDLIKENPLYVLIVIALLWAFGAVLFWRARRMSELAMIPSDQQACDEFLRNQGKCPSAYTPFNAAIYALENVLPVVKLGQDTAWRPNPDFRTPSQGSRWLPKISYRWLAAARWLLILVGWALAIILAGAMGERFAG